VVIVGAGIFGVTAALALRRRGFQVVLLDPGPVPHPLAASTDISKVIRVDYGTDEEYTALAETALEGWQKWNATWSEPPYHPTGVVFLLRSPMTPHTFEHDSYQLLLRRGHSPERLGPDEIGGRFPAWSAGGYVDGYFNPIGGYAESGRVVARLALQARAEGVDVRSNLRFLRLIEAGSRVGGVVSTDGSRIVADRVTVCAGAWTPHLLPWMDEVFRSNGMPVFHLRPARPDLFESGRFPVFCADITETGYYGFPLGREGVVKIATHGPGRRMHPESIDRVVTAEETAELRAFLSAALPELAGAEIVHTHVCLYCDTFDGHFWIAQDPDREGLTVAAGDSGHAFKFAPLLGELVADAAEGRPNSLLRKFRWRPDARPPRGEEAARHRE